MDGSQDVYTGFWINWSRGQVAGATLTVQNGAYLVAFLAMFVRTAGRHFWQLLCYLIFQTLPARDDAESARQQKAVLRNSSSATDGLMRFAKIALSARKVAKRKIMLPFSLAFIALLNITGFAVAGIFSSAVTRTQSEVLLKPTTCGSWVHIDIPTASDWNQAAFVQSMDLVSIIHENAVTSSQYQLGCSNVSSSICNPYSRRSIDFTASNALCPFDSAVCLDNTGLSLDTGFLDSSTDLGINAAKSDRVNVRKQITCSPLKTDGYTQPVSGAALKPQEGFPLNESLTAFFYGNNLRLQSNYTYAFNPASFQTSVGAAVDTESYQLAVEAAAISAATAGNKVAPASTFSPISALRQSNADVTLFFLAKQVSYTSPVLSPWFQAEHLLTQNVSDSDNTASLMELYGSVEPVSVLACSEQTTLRNPRNNQSMFLNLGIEIEDGVGLNLALNAKQSATAQRVFDALSRSTLPQTAFSLGGSGLLAASFVENRISPGLPPDQWALELGNWFSTSLAALQLFTVQYVSGYGRADFNKFVTPPPSTDEWMCHNQIVHRSDFASFNVLGLAMILVCGSLIIGINVGLSRVVPRLRNKFHRRSRSDEEWRIYDILELEPKAEDDATKPMVLRTSTLDFDASAKSESRWLCKLNVKKWPLLPFSKRSDFIELSESPTSASTLLTDDKKTALTRSDTLSSSQVSSPVSPMSSKTD